MVFLRNFWKKLFEDDGLKGNGWKEITGMGWLEGNG
jgi:hypothetical protein